MQAKGQEGVGPRVPGDAASEEAACPKVLPHGQGKVGGVVMGAAGWEGSSHWTAGQLVGDQGLGGGEGSGLGEADEEDPCSFLGHEVPGCSRRGRLLELGIGEGDEAAVHSRAPRWPEDMGERLGEASRCGEGLFPAPESCRQPACSD